MNRGGILAMAMGAALGLQASAHAASAPNLCATVTRPMASGSIPTIADFTAVPCAARRSPFPFRYEPSIKVMRALRDIAPGEMVRAIPAFALPILRPGDLILLSTNIGPVTIERQVEAIQPAFAGETFFVRAADGAVFVAPFPAPQP